MIKVNNLKKSFGAVEALRDVSFEIASGEIVGLLGPNGAGKTTIIKTITGYLQPDYGTVYVYGLNVVTNTHQVQQKIGYLPESAPLYPELSVQSYLKMIADLRQIPEEDQLARISEVVYAVGLEDYLVRPIGHLSKGYRQRVGLAQAILHNPELLILDEPTVGLDPTQIVEIRRLIKRLSQHSTVLFSTHILPEVEALCDRVVILMHGEVKADARLAELATTQDAILVLGENVAGVKKQLLEMGGVENVETFQNPDGYAAFRVIAQADRDINPAIYELASQNHWPLRELRRDVRTLEMVFNDLAMAS